MGGTWEEMGGNGRSNSRSTRGEIAVFDPKTPLLSIMDMNVTRNLHKTYIFVSFLPDSPPFPPVLSRTLPYLPLTLPGTSRNLPETPPETPPEHPGASGVAMPSIYCTWEHLGGTGSVL